jgi:hypothetical protein
MALLGVHACIHTVCEQSIGSDGRTLMDWLHVCTTSAGHTWTKKYMEPFIGSHGRTLMDWMCIFATPAQVIHGSRIHETFHWRPWSDANGLDASLCYSIFFHYAQGKHGRTPIGIHGRTLMDDCIHMWATRVCMRPGVGSESSLL